MPDPIHNAKCFSSHMGLWMIEPGYMDQAVAAIRSGLWVPNAIVAAAQPLADGKIVFDPASDPNYPQVLYVVTPDGVALIQVQGAMAKAKGKYASASTVQARRALRLASTDQDVDGIMMAIDSPGGAVSGTQQLADDVRAADAIKPVSAHIDDMGASAAYWVGSQARRVSANRSALVGSLGTYCVIQDTSGKAEMEGVKVHKVTTGPHKGAFVDGAPVTSEQLAEAQRTVDDLNAMFMEGVAGGRRKSAAETEALFDGRVHIASKAKELGLIDAVQSFDASLAEFTALLAGMPRTPQPDNARRMRMARARS